MIVLENIRKIYDKDGVKTQALNGISLSVEKGEFLMILGQSGSGKTTLLNIMGMIDTPTSGNYSFQNRNMASLNLNELALFRRKEVGFVFQSFNLISDMKVIENVEAPLGYMGISSKERHKRSLEVLKKVGIPDKASRFPAQLSGGQQQRVAIARSLITAPSLILADEPTGNLDTNTTTEIMALLTEINKQGTTIVMITHNLDMLKFATRSLTIRDGEIIQI
jgi:putative ABC transport system ATP-binding protein